MNLLADENIAAELVQILKAHGHSVLTLGEIDMLGSSDAEILDYAILNNLTILTEDKDFGYLLEFTASETSARAILLRYHNIDVQLMAQQLLRAIERIDLEAPMGRMTAVISHGLLRIRL